MSSTSPSASDPGCLLLRAEQAAKMANTSRATIFNLMSRGHIKSMKIGRSRRIPVAELQAWITSEMERQNA
jgi:excisionase family DNA binding protein